MAEMKKLLSAKDVANILNISRAMAYRMMQDGQITVVRIGRSVRVRPEDLEVFRAIFTKLDVKKEPVSLRKVFDILKKEPEIAKQNSHIRAKYVDSDFADLLNRKTTISEKN